MTISWPSPRRGSGPSPVGPLSNALPQPAPSSSLDADSNSCTKKTALIVAVFVLGGVIIVGRAFFKKKDHKPDSPEKPITSAQIVVGQDAFPNEEGYTILRLWKQSTEISRAAYGFLKSGYELWVPNKQGDDVEVIRRTRPGLDVSSTVPSLRLGELPSKDEENSDLTRRIFQDYTHTDYYNKKKWLKTQLSGLISRRNAQVKKESSKLSEIRGQKANETDPLYITYLKNRLLKETLDLCENGVLEIDAQGNRKWKK